MNGRDAHDMIRLRYLLPAPGGAVWLGLPLSSLLGLTVTATVAVTLLLVKFPFPVVAVVAIAGAAAAAWPVAGRPLLAWLPTAGRHLELRLNGRHRWVNHLPADASGGSSADSAIQSFDDRCDDSALSPFVVAGRPIRLQLGFGPRHLTVSELPDPSGPVALLRTAHSATSTVVLEVVGAGRFGLLDPDAQDTELARWGTALATLLADPDVHGISWSTHTRPDTRPVVAPLGPPADAPATATPATAPTPAIMGTSEPVRLGDLLADYQQLVTEARARAVQHRHLLTLTLRPGTSPNDAINAHVRQAATTLLAADLLAHPLSTADLGTELRRMLDPTLPVDGPIQNRGAWDALSTHTTWTTCTTDDTMHRCYTVTGWPRLALTADWLAPLLHEPVAPGTARTLTVHARPVRPDHAARRARAAVAKARLDAGDRHRLGFTPAAADDLAESDAAGTEAELLAGYRMADLSAVVTISAVDLQQLEAAGRQLRTLATAHRLDLRPLHGQHHAGLAASLPLGLHPGASR